MKEEKTVTHIEDRPWTIEKKTWSRLQTFHLYLQQRQTLYISLVGLGFKRGKVVKWLLMD